MLFFFFIINLTYPLLSNLLSTIGITKLVKYLAECNTPKIR
jgi:hypothetical protein